MTAFTPVRTRQRSVRESLQAFRGAVRAATETRGSDYADALLLGRN